MLLTLVFIRRPELYWPIILAVCEPLKLALIVYRIRQPNYVGIFSKAGDIKITSPD